MTSWFSNFLITLQTSCLSYSTQLKSFGQIETVISESRVDLEKTFWVTRGSDIVVPIAPNLRERTPCYYSSWFEDTVIHTGLHTNWYCQEVPFFVGTIGSWTMKIYQNKLQYLYVSWMSINTDSVHIAYKHRYFTFENILGMGICIPKIDGYLTIWTLSEFIHIQDRLEVYSDVFYGSVPNQFFVNHVLEKTELLDDAFDDWSAYSAGNFPQHPRIPTVTTTAHGGDKLISMKVPWSVFLAFAAKRLNNMKPRASALSFSRMASTSVRMDDQLVPVPNIFCIGLNYDVSVWGMVHRPSCSLIKYFRSNAGTHERARE